MSAEQQTTLPLRLKVRGQSASPDGARTILGDLDDAQFNALIEDGRIAWAINVASASALRREIRIPVCCLDDFEHGIQRDYTAAEIATFLFGPLGNHIRGRRFYRALNIAHNHFSALVKEGSIRLATGSHPRKGRGGSALVTRLDAIAFLTARRVL